MFTSLHRRSKLLATSCAAAAVVGGAALAVPAQAAAPRVVDLDAELRPGNRLHLSVETRGATRVTFTIAGRSAKGYLTEIDREDGTREFERNLASRGLQPGTHTIKLRACGADGCTTKTQRTYVEYDD
ncbi:MAG: hypothetical protein J7513_07220 [Solirubrobacteraceae bacterium]|nr:hypothetical protein [Solirubrobacteraceae bacterium]